MLLDGRVLITGGNDATGALATSEIFDPGSMSFSAGPTMAHARTQHTATLLVGGQVLVAGGKDALPGVPFVGFVGDTEIYDPGSNSFTVGSTLGFLRSNHRATRLLDGRVLLTGGETVDDPAKVGAVFDAAGAASSFGPNMTVGRSRHEATLLVDGRVLVTAGLGEVDTQFSDTVIAVNATEIFDPVNNVFTLDVPSLVARYDHRATRLGDGRVLLTGGRNDAGTSLGS